MASEIGGLKVSIRFKYVYGGELKPKRNWGKGRNSVAGPGPQLAVVKGRGRVICRQYTISQYFRVHSIYISETSGVNVRKIRDIGNQIPGASEPNPDPPIISNSSWSFQDHAFGGVLVRNVFDASRDGYTRLANLELSYPMIWTWRSGSVELCPSSNQMNIYLGSSSRLLNWRHSDGLLLIFGVSDSDTIRTFLYFKLRLRVNFYIHPNKICLWRTRNWGTRKRRNWLLMKGSGRVICRKSKYFTTFPCPHLRNNISRERDSSVKFWKFRDHDAGSQIPVEKITPQGNLS